MNYNNVDLNRPYEASQNILDGFSFDILLLEISCNLPIKTKETIRKQFEKSLNDKVNEAKQIFEANLNNILAKALEYENME
jgi:hypothetical protein